MPTFLLSPTLPDRTMLAAHFVPRPYACRGDGALRAEPVLTSEGTGPVAPAATIPSLRQWLLF